MWYEHAIVAVQRADTAPNSAGRNWLPTGASKGHYSTVGELGGWQPRSQAAGEAPLAASAASLRRGGLGAAAAAAGRHHVRWAGAVCDGAQQVQAGHQAEEVREQRIGGGLQRSRTGRGRP